MTVTIWDLVKAILKWKALICALVIVGVLGAYFYVQKSQSYYGEILIKFEDSSIREGMTPTGSKFDVYEILSPNVIIRALENINIKMNIDSIRSRTSISPVIPADIASIKSSKFSDGEEYTYFPYRYYVKFGASSSYTPNDVHDILDALIESYMLYYNETYVTQTDLPEYDQDVSTENHDYLNVAEVIENSIAEIRKTLGVLVDNSSGYRSPSTGYNFSDIEYKYSQLAEFDVPLLYAEIYEGKITKNRDILIKYYQNKLALYKQSSENSTEKASTTFSILKNFAESNTDVANAYYEAYLNQNDDNLPVSDTILDHIYGKTTYDYLITEYVNNKISASNIAIDAAECEKIIEIFSAPLDEEVDAEALKQNALDRMEYIKNEMKRLKELTQTTLDDYNAHVAGQHLSYLTGIRVNANIELKLYAVIAALVGFAVGVMFALVYELAKRYKEFERSGISSFKR